MKLACSLPQESPLSPILFLLYTTALYYTLGQTRSYGYANNAAMLFRGPTLAATIQQASNTVKILQDWELANTATFDPKKTKLYISSENAKTYLETYHPYDTTTARSTVMKQFAG